MRSEFLVAIFMGLVLSSFSAIEAVASPSKKESIVFVHGAHLTSKVWSKVETIMSGYGYETISIDLPGRLLSSDPSEITLDKSTKALCAEIENIQSPIVIVAHSQGGAIANNSLSICPQENLESIVYVAAVAPLNGDTPFSRLSKVDEENYFKGVSYDESGWMIIDDLDKFTDVFTNSKSKIVKNEIISQVVNEPAVIGDGVVRYSLSEYSRLNKLYVYTRFDKVISLSSQKTISRSIGPNNEVILDSGHVPMITEPVKLSNEIDKFIRLR